MATKKKALPIDQLRIEYCSNGYCLVVETLEDGLVVEHREVYGTGVELISAVRRYVPVDKLAIA